MLGVPEPMRQQPRASFLMRPFAIWGILGLILPTFVYAHVKWFSAFSFATKPLTLEEAVTPTFLGLAALSAVVIGGLVLLDRRLHTLPLYQNTLKGLDAYAEHSVLVLRIGIGAALLLAWQADALLANELALTAPWVGWFQFAMAFFLLFQRMVPLAGAGVLILYVLGIMQAGALHMLDYAFYAGAGYYLVVNGIGRDTVRDSGLPALYLSVGFSLCWAALEKIIYPQWGLYVLQQNPELTFGLDVNFFLTAAAFVELSLGYLLIIGLMERPMALAITLVFFSTTLIFGKLEVIGHTPIHAALIVFLLQGPGRTYRAPYTFHKRLPLRTAFASVNFALVVGLLLTLYASAAMRQYEQHRTMATMHEHPPFEMPTDQPIPTVALMATPDPIGGWNVKLETTNFTFTPETVGDAAVAGEGHAHLYLNDEKIARLYGPWHHIPELPPGTYTLRVTLHANDHSLFVHAGQPLMAQTTLASQP